MVKAEAAYTSHYLKKIIICVFMSSSSLLWVFLFLCISVQKLRTVLNNQNHSSLYIDLSKVVEINSGQTLSFEFREIDKRD